MSSRSVAVALTMVVFGLSASTVSGVMGWEGPLHHQGVTEGPSVDPKGTVASPPAPVSSRSLNPSAGDFDITVLTIPSFCTIFIGSLTFGNDSVYSGISGGEFQISSNYCAGEAFINWSTTGGLSVNRSTANPAALQVESSGTLTALFALGYNVTFNETGLLFGTTWTVTINGNPVSSSSATPTLVVFQEPNGSYPYQIARVPLFAAKYSGTVVVQGRDVLVNVTFTSLTYDVEFFSTGLASSTLWSVTLNYTQYYSHSPWITFAEINGTYPYTVSWVPDYSMNVTSGNVTVTGHQIDVYVRFAQNSTSSASTLSTDEKYEIVGGGAAVVVVVAAVLMLLRGRPK